MNTNEITECLHNLVSAISRLNANCVQISGGNEANAIQEYLNGVETILQKKKPTNYDVITGMPMEKFAAVWCAQIDCEKCFGREHCVLDGGNANGLVKYLKEEAQNED